MITNFNRNGKIARLPFYVRDELNLRLAAGERTPSLLAWLNRRRDVREVMQEEFDGTPINEQNLSAWRQGGYVEWERHRETEDWAEEQADRWQAMMDLTAGMPLADLVAMTAVMELKNILEEAAQIEDFDQRSRKVLAAARQITQLQRAGHQGERLRMTMRDWDEEWKQAGLRKVEAAVRAGDQERAHKIGEAVLEKQDFYKWKEVETVDAPPQEEEPEEIETAQDDPDPAGAGTAEEPENPKTDAANSSEDEGESSQSERSEKPAEGCPKGGDGKSPAIKVNQGDWSGATGQPRECGVARRAASADTGNQGDSSGTNRETAEKRAPQAESTSQYGAEAPPSGPMECSSTGRERSPIVPSHQVVPDDLPHTSNQGDARSIKPNQGDWSGATGQPQAARRAVTADTGNQGESR